MTHRDLTMQQLRAYFHPDPHERIVQRPVERVETKADEAGEEREAE